MKNKILFTCVATTLLLSCTATKKVLHKTDARTDSTGITTSKVVELKKKDSTGTNVTVTTTTKTTDEGYKETTVIKEYFGDEFDLSGEKENDYTGAPVKKDQAKPAIGRPINAAAKDTAKHSAKVPATVPRLQPYYRETTTTVEGTKKTKEDQVKAEDIKTNTSSTDSTAKEDQQKVVLKKDVEVTDTTKTKKTFFPWYIWAFIGAFLFVCWRVYRNS